MDDGDRITRRRLPAEVLESLPDVYARTLTLLAEGGGPEEISDRLGIPLEAVPALIELAERKADRAMAEHRDGGYH